MRIQVAFFYFLCLLFSWLAWLPLYAWQIGLAKLRGPDWFYSLGFFGPFLASCISTAVFQKNAGLKSFLSGYLQFRPVLYLLIAIVVPWLLEFLANIPDLVMLGRVAEPASPYSWFEEPKPNFFPLFLSNLFFTGIGAETGWRGFLLPRLQEKFSALWSAVAIGILCAVWQLPLLFYKPGLISADIVDILGLATTLIALNILLTWLYNSSGGGILMCAVLSAGFETVFTKSPWLESRLIFLLILTAVLLVAVFKKENLARSERQKIRVFDDEEEQSAKQLFLEFLTNVGATLKNFVIDFAISSVLLIAFAAVEIFIFYVLALAGSFTFLSMVLFYPLLFLTLLLCSFILFRLRPGPLKDHSPGRNSRVLVSTLVTCFVSLIWANPLVMFVSMWYLLPLTLMNGGSFFPLLILSVTPFTLALMKAFADRNDRRSKKTMLMS